MKKISLSEKTLNYLNIEKNKCVNCKKCYSVCPMIKAYFKPIQNIFEQIVKECDIDEHIPYSCMKCGLCKKVCPMGIDLGAVFFKLRKEIFLNRENNLKSLGYRSIKFHQRSSFSSIFTYDELEDKTKKIFLPGCSLSAYNADLVINTFNYLKKHIANLSLIYECCGSPTIMMGDENRFFKHYSKLVKIIRENRIDEVIVACPNCYNVLKKYSPELEVTFIWDKIARFGLPDNLINYYGDLDVRFTIHDPCPIREEKKLHENVRLVLEELGLKIDEFKNNREFTECCGAGAMAMLTSKEIAIRQAKKRANETNNDTIISYCQTCSESMIIAGKKSLHILDFIFNTEVLKKNKFTQIKESTAKKWMTRRKGINKIKKLVDNK